MINTTMYHFFVDSFRFSVQNVANMITDYITNQYSGPCEKYLCVHTFIIVFSIRAVLFKMNIATGAEPPGLAPALPLHVVVGLALAVQVAVAWTALQGAVFPVPA